MKVQLRWLALLVLALMLGAPAARGQGLSRWFLAEGANNAVFTEEILIGNPNSQALDVTVTLLPQADAVAPVLSRTFVLGATSRLTVRLGNDFDLDGIDSALVSAVIQGTTTPADIVVERTMTFRGAAALGSHNASGVPAGGLSTSWILAEGANGAQTPGEIALGFDTFVLVANPNPTATEVRATYLTASGLSLVSTQTAPPNSRVTFWPRAEHATLGNAEFSTLIDSLTAGNKVVAERAMYFDDFRSGHDALGVTSPSLTWYFAEGFTGGNAVTAFETFLLLVNPGTTATTATVDYLLDSGEVITRTYPLQPRERFTIWVDQEGRTADARLTAAAFGMRVTSPVPIVAERAMYWGTPSSTDVSTPTFPWIEGHATAGITAPAATWAFAEGQQGAFGATGTRYETFFQVANPQATPIAIQATFAREDGAGIVRTVCVLGNARANIWTALYPELEGQRFATFLKAVPSTDPACPAVAAAPFIAERAVYAGPGFQSGHVNTGTAWAGAIATPRTPSSACVLRLLPETQAVSAAGQSFTTALSATCAWNVTSDANWLVIDGPTAGTGSATLSYRALANTSATERTGRLTVEGTAGGSAQLIVTQAGTGTAACSYTLVPTSQSVPAAGGATSFTVNSNRSGCTYTAAPMDAWLTVTGGGSGASGTVSVNVGTYSGITTRNGRVRVSWTGGTSDFTVMQQGSGALIADFTLAYDGKIYAESETITLRGSGFYMLDLDASSSRNAGSYSWDSSPDAIQQKEGQYTSWSSTCSLQAQETFQLTIRLTVTGAGGASAFREKKWPVTVFKCGTPP